MQLVLVTITPDRNIHILRGILRGARAEAIGTQRKVIVAALVVVVLATCVELAKNKLPVKALLFGIPVERAATTMVLYLKRAISKNGKGNKIAKALARLVNCIRENLKGGMSTAIQAVRAKDNCRTEAYALLVFKLSNTVVSIGGHSVLPVLSIVTCRRANSTPAKKKARYIPPSATTPISKQGLRNLVVFFATLT